MTLLIAFCDICGKKLKGENKRGLETSRGMHYKKVHDMEIMVIEGEGSRTLYKLIARGSTT